MNARTAATRAFIRQLNILLKFARMYEFSHPRTVKQYEKAWDELRGALDAGDVEAGLLLAVSGDQLLVDGAPLEQTLAEASFARMLSSAGIASIHFSPKTTQDSLGRLARAFPSGGGTKPGQLAEQLKAAFRDDPHIRVNEVCFVPADSAVAKSTIAAQLAAHSAGANSPETDEIFNDPQNLLKLIAVAEGAAGRGGEHGREQSDSQNETSIAAQLVSQALGPKSQGADELFNDPEKLLQLIAAAEGTKANHSGTDAAPDGEQSRSVGSPTEEPTEPAGGTAGSGPRSASGETGEKPEPGWVLASSEIRGGRPARGGAGSMTLETGFLTLKEDELKGILAVLAQIGRTSVGSNEKLDPASFQSRISTLPRRARFTVAQALAGLAAQAPNDAAGKPVLVKLAEHIAIRFALQSYERGDVRVDAVHEMLGNLNREIEALRKSLGIYEERMIRAGIEPPAEVLEQEFWKHAPEGQIRTALESEEAWCVPISVARGYMEDLLSRGESEAVGSTLRNYAGLVTNTSAEARRGAAMRLVELAPLYAKCGERLLADAIRQTGVRLAEEPDPQLRGYLSAAFVALSQEAVKQRCYLAVQRAAELVDYAEEARPGAGKDLRPLIAIEDKLPEFIEEALRAGEIAPGLKDLLRRLSRAASEQIAGRFSRSGLREDCELLISMIEAAGPEALEHLREQFHSGESNQAIHTIGILARLDMEMLKRELPGRLKGWPRAAHDRVVRQIAASGAPEQGRLLLDLLNHLDPLIQPLAIDEISMWGEQSAGPRLMAMANGNLPGAGTPYLRLKAIEALGRLRTPGAASVLKSIAEGRKTWRWIHPAELRVAAVQALQKMDPEWARRFIPKSGLSAAELSLDPLDNDPHSTAIRQRRYARLRLRRPLKAVTTNLKENCQVEIPEMTLGGGIALSAHSLHPGSIVELLLNPEQKTAVTLQAIIRDAHAQARVFEIAEMDLEERAKLRKLLTLFGSAEKQATPQKRSRRKTRAFLAGGSESVRKEPN